MHTYHAFPNLFQAKGFRGILLIVLVVISGRSQLWSEETKSAHARPEPVPLAPLDPESSEIPRQWFKNIPVKPIGGLGLSPDENEPYYRILEHVRNLPEKSLSAADQKFRRLMIEEFGKRTSQKITDSASSEAQKKSLQKQLVKRLQTYQDDLQSYPLIRDAFNLPEQCQGKVVSFRGHIRQATSFPAGENEFGIETLYQITLFDEESNGFPVIIITTEVPQDLPLNFPDSEVYDGVFARGYYFKLFAYEGHENLQAVPLILAHSVKWNPPEVRARTFPAWGYGLVIAFGVLALWIIVRSNRADSRLKSVREQMSSPEDNPFHEPN